MTTLPSEKTAQAPDFNRLVKKKPVKVIAVTSGKGGVGKSCISINLAIALAQKNKKVLLLDADLGLANIDIMLGLASNYNLSHVVQGICHLRDTLLQGPCGIRIISGASGADSMVNLTIRDHAGIINSFDELSDDWDYMIIDTSSGVSESVLSFTRSAQDILVVLSDEPASIIDSYALIKLMSKRYQCRHFHVLANMVSDAQEGKLLFNKLQTLADQFLDVQLDYLGSIAFDKRMRQSIKMRQAMILAFPDSNAAQSIFQLASKVQEWPINLSINGNTRFFIERLVAG